MPQDKRNKNRKKRKRTSPVTFLLIIMVLLLIGTGVLIRMCLRIGSSPAENGKSESHSSANVPSSQQGGAADAGSSETTQPEPVHQISSATITSTGDILMHKSVINSGKDSDGNYDYNSIFRYVREYTTAADWAVANLETTLAGTAKPYNGNPNFNCPDAIAEALKTAGFDMLLTANNHSADTELAGIKRTLEVVRSTGMETIGTYSSADETKWTIQNINGIQVGLLCYTYADNTDKQGNPLLNWHEVGEAGIVNFFTTDHLETFYSEAAAYLQQLKDAGADVTMLYIHWGTEYDSEGNIQQQEIAQKMCDLGVDVIVGGHPHVVQPMDLLTSTVDTDHKTVVLYSMGNAVSNQRKEEMTNSKPTGETEDGVLFSVTFVKYSDGSVYLESTDLLPCWVDLRTGDSKDYVIIPLADSDRSEWETRYELSAVALQSAQSSYQRTMNVVGSGLAKCQEYLNQCSQARALNPAA